MKLKIKKVIQLALGSVIILGFQNCSQTNQVYPNSGNSSSTAPGTSLNASSFSSFFGININKITSPWPTSLIPPLKFASYRSLASGITWANINSTDGIHGQEGVYNWTNYDAWIAKAQSGGQDVLFTLFVTPSWASSHGINSSSPDNSCTGINNGPGICDRPDDLNLDGTGTDQHFIDFVTALVQRSCTQNLAQPYSATNTLCGSGNPGGRIKYYEVWNEPNIAIEWNNTQDGGNGINNYLVLPIIRMAQDARSVVKSIDPSAVMTTPPVTSPSGTNAAAEWILYYLSSGGGKYADIFGLHGYVQQQCLDPCPASSITPEKIIAIIDFAQNSIIPTYNFQTSPFFITETGLACKGASCPLFANQALNQAFLARYYLLTMSNSINKVYWFGWDMGSGDFYDPTTNAILPNATTFLAVYNWTVGSTFSGPCTASGSIWTCNLTLSNGTKAQALWDASQSCTGTTSPVCSTSQMTVGSQYLHYLDVNGNTTPITKNTVSLGAQPILIETQ